MVEHLKEFVELVDMVDTWKPGRGIPEPPDDETVTRCIQLLMARQCIYGWMHGIGPSYRVLATPEYQGFFKKYFAAMGNELVHDTRSGMIALKVPSGVPRYDQRSGRLKKDVTSVLLALRIAYDEAFRNKQWNDLGTVDITTDDLYDKLGIVGSIIVEPGRLTEILTFCEGKGVVKLGERDPVDKVTPLTILPGIEIAVTATYVERVLAAAEAIPPSSSAIQDGVDAQAAGGAAEDPATGDVDEETD
jgi:hypothetical protein